jgi:hypothetical protein
MRWFKIAAIAGGILIAFLIVGSVVHFIMAAITTIVIAALVVGGIAVAIKVGQHGKQVSGKKAEREVREHQEPYQSLPRAEVDSYPATTATTAAPTPRRAASSADIDDELAKLKREMGS